MRNRLTCTLALASACALSAMPSAARASFVLIDDFETGYTVGSSISGVNGWTATSEYTAELDPDDATNTVLRFTQDNQTRDAYKALPVTIGTSSAGTVFGRFRFDSANRNGNWGVTDVDNPNDFGHYSAQLNVQANQSINVRDGNSFEELRPLNSATERAGSEDTWYQIWLYIDNSNDTYRVFIQSDGDTDFTTQVEVFGNGSNADPINFRKTTTTAIDRLFLRNGTGPLYWDDFYIDNTGLNLGNPIPEPASIALVALGGALILARRRA